MQKNNHVTRRSFMQMVGSSGLLSFAPPLLALDSSSQARKQQPRFAYVASSGKSEHGIHAFAIKDGRWTQAQFTASAAPSALALSHDQQTLYVANRIRKYQNLPTASIEAYSISLRTGHLALINRQALALSAIEPEHLAVSPDGKYLAVSVTGGGSYNVLPIAEDGSLQPVAALRKEVGYGPHPIHQTSSQPQHIAFDSAGRLIASDLGTDRVTVFEFAEDSLQVKQRAATAPESGPSMLAASGQHSLLFIGNALNGTITAHRYDAVEGHLLPEQNSVQAVLSGSLRSVVAHPQQNVLYSAAGGDNAGTVTAWEFDPTSGSLKQTASLRLQGEPASLSVAPDGKSLFALDRTNGVVIAIEHDAAAAFMTAAHLANVTAPTSLAFTYS